MAFKAGDEVVVTSRWPLGDSGVGQRVKVDNHDTCYVVGTLMTGRNKGMQVTLAPDQIEHCDPSTCQVDEWTAEIHAAAQKTYKEYVDVHYGEQPQPIATVEFSTDTERLKSQFDDACKERDTAVEKWRAADLRANKLADDCGNLRHENDMLLKENATLRRGKR